MAKITLPPSEGGQFPVVPDDVYKLRIINPRLAYAKTSGAPTIECHLKVLEGKYAGVELYHQYSLLEQALWKIKLDMRAMGVLSLEAYPEGKPIELEDDEIATLLEDVEGYGSIFSYMYQGGPRSKLATPGFLTPEQVKERGIAAVAPKKLIPEAQEPF